MSTSPATLTIRHLAWTAAAAVDAHGILWRGVPKGPGKQLKRICGIVKGLSGASSTHQCTEGVRSSVGYYKGHLSDPLDDLEAGCH